MAGVDWGHGTWAVQRARFTLTREEAGQFVADQQELIGRYRQKAADAPAGARTVVFGFLAYPEPAQGEIPDSPGEPVGEGS